jgi:hypothetical protein
MNVLRAEQFYGLLNDGPIAKSLFSDFKTREVYLFEVIILEDATIAEITIFDKSRNVSRKAVIPSPYLRNLYIILDSPAAKTLFSSDVE